VDVNGVTDDLLCRVLALTGPLPLVRLHGAIHRRITTRELEIMLTEMVAAGTLTRRVVGGVELYSIAAVPRPAV
jgi:hypothetical protein